MSPEIKNSPDCRAMAGHTLIEAVLAVAIMALIVGIAAVSLVAMVDRSRLDKDVGKFARTLRTAAEQAVFRNENIEVVIEVLEGYYTVYQDGKKNEADQEEDEPLIDRQVLEEFYIEDIEFEDGSHQYSGEIVLKATPQGWKGSVLINLISVDDKMRFVRCDRMTTGVIDSRQMLELPESQSHVSMYSPM